MDLLYKNSLTPLHHACLSGRKAVVAALIAAGASLVKKDQEEHMPLHCASWSGHADIVNELVKAGSPIVRLLTYSTLFLSV